MSNSIRGVGLNLRLEFIDEFLRTKPDVDFVEVILDNYHSDGPHHKKLEIVRRDYEVSFHCVGMNLAGTDDLNEKYFDKTNELINKFSPFQISDHLCFQAVDGNQLHDLLPFPLTSSFLDSTVSRVEKIQEMLKQEILIENLSYYVEFKNTEMKEYEFINMLTEKTGAKILFDLNNIWVNEKNLKLSANEYIENINWKSVSEIHLAGAEIFDGTYIDTHGEVVSDDVMELVRLNKDKLINLPVIYERDNNIPSLDKILEETTRIREVIRG